MSRMKNYATKTERSRKATRRDAVVGNRVYTHQPAMGGRYPSEIVIHGTVQSVERVGACCWVCVAWDNGDVFSIRPRECRVVLVQPTRNVDIDSNVLRLRRLLMEYKHEAKRQSEEIQMAEEVLDDGTRRQVTLLADETIDALADVG